MKEENCVLHNEKRDFREIFGRMVPLAAVLLVSALFLFALPSKAEAEVIASGFCGDATVNGGNDVIWSLDGNGTLTISGSGRMNNYAQAEDVPWHEQRRSIKKAVISGGVTSVGGYAFADCPNLRALELTVEAIGDEAFRNCTAAEIYYPSGCTLGTNTFDNAVAAIEYTVTDGSTALRLTASNGVGITIPETIGGGTVKSLQNDLRPGLSIAHAGAHHYVDGTCSICGKPQGDVVEISPENFPDGIFRSYVSDFDTDRDGGLSQDEIRGVTLIKVDGKGISSLQGIEFFTALEELSFVGNSIETLDISKNTELELIYGDDNRLTTLDVSRNTKLTKLFLQENPVQSLDVSDLSLLEVLWLSDAPIKELDVSRNLLLNYLSMYYCGLEAIDLSNNQELKWLGLDGNALSELDVTQNSGLLSLSCEENSLTSLDVSQNPLLETLYCSKNQITELNLQNNPELTTLWCSENKLTGLDVTPCKELTELFCWWNELATLQVSGLDKLLSLDCENNLLTGLDLNGCTALAELNFGYNELGAVDLTGNPNLRILHCWYNELEELDLSANKELTEVQCRKNNMKSLNISGLRKLTTLKCQYNSLTALSVNDNTALTTLWAWSNMLTSIDVSQNVLLDVENYEIFNLNDNIYTINNSGTFDLSKLPGNFVSDKAGRWEGATFDSGMLTDFTSDTVTYWYNCGRNDKLCYFMLKVAHGHKLVKHDAVAADCEEDGTGEYWKCEGEGGCNKLFGDEEGTIEIEEIPVIAATGHKWDKWSITTEPTLTTGGTAEHICTKNREHKETKALPKLDDETFWTPGETVAPGEETDGSQEYTSECGSVTIVLPATGHTHVWGEWSITTKPTLTTGGTAERTCTKNREHKEAKALPKLEDETFWTPGKTVAPGEETDGSQEYTSEYGSVTVVLPATGKPSVPDKPEITDTPDRPEITDTPDRPEITDTPDRPEITDTPDRPEITDTPDRPEITDTPDKPEITDTPDKPDLSDSGKISKAAQSGENAPETELITPLSELIAVVLTDEEQGQVAHGVDIRIVLTVEDGEATVPVKDKEAVQSALEELSDYQLGQYLDINLWKIIGEAQEKIAETKGSVTVTFEVPKNLSGEGRRYAVVRIHGGESTLLPDLDDDENTVTIQSDRFSTYALIYSEETGSSQPVEPATGERRSVADAAAVIFPAILSAAALLLLLERRKR